MVKLNGKLAIVVGHNKRSQGAVRVTDGRTEFDWNSQLAKMIRDHDPKNIKIFYRKKGGGYSAEIDRVYAQVNKWGADLSVELHFNGSHDPDASGCKMLSSGTIASLAFAQWLQTRCNNVLGNRSRDVGVLSRHDRGGRSLWQGEAPAVLTEPYFGTNAADCRAADVHMDKLAEAHFRAAREMLS